MPRAHYVDTLLGTSGTGMVSVLGGATIHVYDQGTTNLVSQTLYTSDVGSGTLTNPFTSEADGTVELWLATAARVDLVATKTGYATIRRTIDVEDVPGSGGGSGTWVRDSHTVLSAPATSLVVTVPAGAEHIQVRAALLNTDTSAGAGPLYLRVNADANEFHYATTLSQVRSNTTTDLTIAWDASLGTKVGEVSTDTGAMTVLMLDAAFVAVAKQHTLVVETLAPDTNTGDATPWLTRAAVTHTQAEALSMITLASYVGGDFAIGTIVDVYVLE